MAHIPNDDTDKNIVNHKKGKKHDCRASQLEWVTQSENARHAWEKGLRKSNNAEQRYKAYKENFKYD